MHNNKLTDATVKVLFDLDSFYTEHGTYNKLEPVVSRTRYFVDSQRTDVLRNLMHGLIGMTDMSGDYNFIDKTSDNYKESLEYVKDYLLEESTYDDNRYYYMNLKKSKSNPSLFFLDIVLKEGFFAYLKGNPSERIKIILQDILELLYENGITDRLIIGHYMGLCFKGTHYFENNFIRFLGEK